MKYGIIGNGVVGNATATIFERAVEREWRATGVANAEVMVDQKPLVLRWDIDPAKCTHDFAKVAECDYVFICVPTPGTGRGPLDMTPLWSVAGKLREYKPTCAVIRSTINVGITRDFAEASHWPTLFWPEFLNERSAVEDALNPKLTLLGSSGEAYQQGTRFASQLTSIFGKLVMPEAVEEVEFIKLASNACGAVQVSLANEIRDLCLQADVEWPIVKEYLVKLGRMIPTYSNVPGPDGKKGYGGTCFPKDIAATAAMNRGLSPSLLGTSIARNRLDRNS